MGLVDEYREITLESCIHHTVILMWTDLALAARQLGPYKVARNFSPHG